MRYNRTPVWTILSMLTNVCKPLMLDEPGTPGMPTPGAPAPGATPPVVPPAVPPATPPEHWNKDLDVSFKDHPSVAKSKTLNDFVKSSLERDKLIGRKGIIVPVEGASEEEVNKFYNELGRPETVEGYKADNTQIPEGVKIDEAARASFLTEAHKLGLNQKQVSGLMNWQIAGEGVRSKASEDERTALLHKAETALRGEYGVAYDAKMAQANKVVDAFADEPAKDALSEALGHDPRMIKMMVNISEAMGEDSLGKALPNAVKTPAEAQKEIDQIRAKKDHPFNVGTHPEHKKAVQYMSDLYDMTTPNQRK